MRRRRDRRVASRLHDVKRVIHHAKVRMLDAFHQSAGIRRRGQKVTLEAVQVFDGQRDAVLLGDVAGLAEYVGGELQAAVVRLLQCGPTSIRLTSIRLDTPAFLAGRGTGCPSGHTLSESWIGDLSGNRFAAPRRSLTSML